MQQRLAFLISNELKQEYSEICGFFRDMVSLVVVISNTHLLRGSIEKEAYIYLRPDLGDWGVMALLVPWRG